jgi:hypothetical protein
MSYEYHPSLEATIGCELTKILPFGYLLVILQEAVDIGA